MELLVRSVTGHGTLLNCINSSSDRMNFIKKYWVEYGTDLRVVLLFNDVVYILYICINISICICYKWSWTCWSFHHSTRLEVVLFLFLFRYFVSKRIKTRCTRIITSHRDQHSCPSIITHKIQWLNHKIKIKSWSVLWWHISLFHVSALILIRPKLSSFPEEVSVSGLLSKLSFYDKVARGANIPHSQRKASHTPGGLFIRQHYHRGRTTQINTLKCVWNGTQTSVRHPSIFA